jgi:tetratricopeptide (TPR) repeat protein
MPLFSFCIRLKLKIEQKSGAALKKMSKNAFLCFCGISLFAASALAKDYLSKNFVIHSDLDPRYVQLAQANAEAYYKNLEEHYFQTSWAGQPLVIYYSETQSETQQLLKSRGETDEAVYSYYVPSVPAVYAHRLTDDGQPCGWNGLFCGIAHHFIQINFQDPPAWFGEGLACFMGERAQIVKDKIILGGPNTCREQISSDKIEEGEGIRANIKRLFTSSTEQFRNWDIGPHFAETFFYWLHENGQLEQYLKNVEKKEYENGEKKGYELSVLEETVSKPYGRINVELSRFMEETCRAEAYLQTGCRDSNEAQKKESFLKALKIKPDYRPAQLELAKCYYHDKNYQKSRDYLKQILSDLESIEYRQAAGLMGNTYYNEKNYSQALDYYMKAWEYSKYYEYKYLVAYQIANCHYYLKDSRKAKKWYREFLGCVWQPDKMKACTDYAQKYAGRTVETTDAEAGK